MRHHPKPRPVRRAAPAPSSRPAPRARRAAAGLAAVAVVLLGAATAAAQQDIAGVLGQPVLALAQRPEMTTALRFNAGGHRGVLAARLRDPGPPVAIAEDRYLFGWGCRTEGCREGGAFLGFDLRTERIYLLLTERGSVRLSVPPDPQAWPEALRPGLTAFVPALGEAMGPR